MSDQIRTPRVQHPFRPGVLAGLLAVAVAVQAGCASSSSKDGSEKGNDDKDFRGRVEELIQAYESRQIGRISAFYAPDVLTLTFDVPFKYDTGSWDSLSTVRRALDQLVDLKVVPSEPNEDWKYKNKVWTLRPFRMECTIKDGTKLVWAGRHSAIWEKRNGAWVIVNEHFLDEPEASRPLSAPKTPRLAAPAEKAIPAAPTPAAWAGHLEDVFFDLDKWNIRKDQQARLAADAAFLVEFDSFLVALEGHCDERASEPYNDVLGQRRAESVKAFLVEHGVDPARIETVSFGKKRPFELGVGENVWQQNRRTHFVVREKP